MPVEGGEGARPRGTAAREALRCFLVERSYLEGDFVLASGARSSFYVDLKRTTYDAEGRRLLGEALADRLEAEGLAPQSIGGLTLGADAVTHALGTALAARGRAVREATVRKATKDHGRRRRIEGNFQPGDRVLVIDDVVTTAGSTVEAVEAFREAGGEVTAAMAVVDREQGGRERLAGIGVRLHALFTLEELRSARVG